MPAKKKFSNTNLLEILQEDAYRDFFQGFREVSYHRRSQVCAPGDDGDQVFVVKSGRLRVYLAWEDKEFTLAFLEPGDIFSSHTRAFVQTQDDAIVLTTDLARFQQQAASVPPLAQVMVKVLGDLLKNSITIIEGLAFKDVRRRLAQFLIGAAADKGRPGAKGVAIALGLTTEDLALLIGTTRQTVSTLLNDWIRLGVLVRIDRKTLLIRDLGHFQDLVGAPSAFPEFSPPEKT